MFLIVQYNDFLNMYLTKCDGLIKFKRIHNFNVS